MLSRLPLLARHSRVVLSGIQPTGVPHLGNYLGALSNWVQLQQRAQPDDGLLFMIAGWHALTLPQDPQTLAQSRWDMLATLLAIGLDPKRSVIFFQDHNQDHAELGWLLNCLCPVGKLRRMTTWKSRLATSRNADEDDVDESLLNAGLLTYPALQAADILVYRATHVPVGEDQTQHLELTRDLADSFNRTFKTASDHNPLFPLPTLVGTASRRILSLKDSSSKMSKSAPDPSSRILLTDTPDQISLKIRGAVTDSIKGITYDPVNRPGTANLLTILAACTQEEADVASVARRYESKGHGVLKTDVSEAVIELLRRPRARFTRLKQERGYLIEVAEEGARKAREMSEETLKLVRERVGLC
ncbi:tryptophanyl-tRNA synthetase [Macrolepiota fuliginosa MF-IS2]|uniref:tryptophan--tRNA ligase n=1 Tax=Macrolepiota fuliginosa MF-IS2 TaxID=1400762 RepID=A0A9P6BXB8_9AGAR|nr:tryptophanyl-tRNA synthetase [Macrolepiota fuliginosa MF-IS2]